MHTFSKNDVIGDANMMSTAQGQMGMFQPQPPTQPKFTPRPYQAAATSKAVWYLRKYDNPFILQLATGAGKSLVIADICHKLDEPVLILQPSKEILEQNYSKLQSFGVTDVSIYSASMNQKIISKYTYATIGSIYKKPEQFAHFKYVIIDECHLVNPKSYSGMYMKFLKAINCKKVCGLTATPYRNQGSYIFENGSLFYTTMLKMMTRMGRPAFFKTIAYQIETKQLIQEGFLSPIDYVDSHLDFSELQVNSTGNEFTDKSLEDYWTGKGGHRLQKLAESIKYIDETHKKNLIFCSSIKQATAAVNMLADMGIHCELVTGGTPTKDREDIIRRFRSGELRHIANVGVFTVGFDVPELDSIVLARPTMSIALYYQMVGRGVRLDPGDPEKFLTVYDFAGCLDRHGKVEDIHVGKEPEKDPTKTPYKDQLETSHGVISAEPLFKFQVKNKSKIGMAAAFAKEAE